MERHLDGEISRGQAAQELGIGYATFKRLLDAKEIGVLERGDG